MILIQRGEKSRVMTIPGTLLSRDVVEYISR